MKSLVNSRHLSEIADTLSSRAFYIRSPLHEWGLVYEASSCMKNQIGSSTIQRLRDCTHIWHLESSGSARGGYTHSRYTAVTDWMVALDAQSNVVVIPPLKAQKAKMAPPFRADQIGSLLRPQELLGARKSVASPSQMYDRSQDDSLIAEAEASAVHWAVQQQLSQGIRPLTSGEYTRHIFYGGFFETLEGMKAEPELPIPQAFRSDFPTTEGLRAMGAKTRAAVVCTGPIRWRRSAYLREWELVCAALGGKGLKNQVKITLPAPSYQHIQLKAGTAWTAESGYDVGGDEAYFDDLAAAYRAEIMALYGAGCRNVQIDDPCMTYFADQHFLRGLEKDGTDAEELLDLYLRAQNKIFQGLPEDLHTGVHLCRGNMSASTHWVTGSYEAIAEKLFNRTKYHTYFLEFDNVESQGGFAPLRFLPKGKNVVLGLVSTKRAELEDVEALVARIKQAAEVVAGAQGVSQEEAFDYLAVSPQCGFSSSSLAGGKGMTMERMWEKLQLVQDVASKVWS